MRRVNIRAILGDEVQRRALMIATCIALQAREGITTTYEQASAAYARTRGNAAGKGAKRATRVRNAKPARSRGGA